MTAQTIFLDTNVLVYAFVADDRRHAAAMSIMGAGGVIGVQVLNEWVNVMRRKDRLAWVEVRAGLAFIRVCCPICVPMTDQTHANGLRIAQRYGFHIYDSLMIAAALDAGCGTLLTEDMNDGQVIEGSLTLRNPFVG